MSSFDLPTFCALIQEHKITYTYVAPPVVLHLAKSPVVAEYDLSSLRMITSGAAPLTKELIYAVHKRLGTEVKQAYGLSETSPVTHMQVCVTPFSVSHMSTEYKYASCLRTIEKLAIRPRLQRSRATQPDRKVHVPGWHRGATGY